MAYFKKRTCICYVANEDTQLCVGCQKEKEEHEKTRHLYTNIKIQFDENKQISRWLFRR